MDRPTKYSPGVRQWAVRLVVEQEHGINVSLLLNSRHLLARVETAALLPNAPMLRHATAVAGEVKVGEWRLAQATLRCTGSPPVRPETWRCR